MGKSQQHAAHLWHVAAKEAWAGALGAARQGGQVQAGPALIQALVIRDPRHGLQAQHAMGAGTQSSAEVVHGTVRTCGVRRQPLERLPPAPCRSSAGHTAASVGLMRPIRKGGAGGGAGATDCAPCISALAARALPHQRHRAPRPLPAPASASLAGDCLLPATGPKRRGRPVGTHLAVALLLGAVAAHVRQFVCRHA